MHVVYSSKIVTMTVREVRLNCLILTKEPLFHGRMYHLCSSAYIHDQISMGREKMAPFSWKKEAVMFLLSPSF